MKKKLCTLILSALTAVIGATLCLTSCADGTFDESQPELPEDFKFPDADMGKYLTSYVASFRVDKLELDEEMAYVRLSPELISKFVNLGYKIESAAYTIDGKDVIPVYTNGVAVTAYGHYSKGEHTAAANITVSYGGKRLKTLTRSAKFQIYGYTMRPKAIDCDIDIMANLEGYPLKARLYVNEQRSDPDYEIRSVSWTFKSQEISKSSTSPYTCTVQSPGVPELTTLNAWIEYGQKRDPNNNRYYYVLGYSGTMPNSKNSKWGVEFKLLTSYHVYNRSDDIVGIARVYTPSSSHTLSIEIDGLEVLSTSEFPYEFHIPASELTPGLHTITGRFTRSDIPSSEGNTLDYIENPFVVVE